MYNTCNYMFKKGKNIGLKCSRKSIYNNLCKQHIIIYYNKWLKNKLVDPFTNKPINSTLFNIFNNLKINTRNHNNIDLINMCFNFKINEDKPLIKIKNFNKLVYKVSENISNYNSIEHIPQTIGNWVLNKKIGSGGFGVIYDAYNIANTNKLFAIKIEHKLSPGLYNETKIYNIMYKNKYIPILYDYGIYKNLRFIVIEKLYKFNFSYEHFNEIINGIESFSKFNISHGDIKLENIMQRKSGEIVFIDFGLSKIIKQCKSKNISGTLLYMSLNAHIGLITNKNDIESLLYCLLQFQNKLPWDNNKFCNENLEHVFFVKLKFYEDIMKNNKQLVKKFKLNKNKKLYLFLKNVIYSENMDYLNIKKIFR